jgi:hypothetical protein
VTLVRYAGVGCTRGYFPHDDGERSDGVERAPGTSFLGVPIRGHNLKSSKDRPPGDSHGQPPLILPQRRLAVTRLQSKTGLLRVQLKGRDTSGSV